MIVQASDIFFADSVPAIEAEGKVLDFTCACFSIDTQTLNPLALLLCANQSPEAREQSESVKLLRLLSPYKRWPNDFDLTLVCDELDCLHVIRGQSKCEFYHPDVVILYQVPSVASASLRAKLPERHSGTPSSPRLIVDPLGHHHLH